VVYFILRLSQPSLKCFLVNFVLFFLNKISALGPSSTYTIFFAIEVVTEIFGQRYTNVVNHYVHYFASQKTYLFVYWLHFLNGIY
jgi:hypothetical protein